jgi:hypothetical protein
MDCERIVSVKNPEVTFDARIVPHILVANARFEIVLLLSNSSGLEV